MSPYKVVMVRHGESEWNVQNRFSGWYDAKLTAKGILEAQKAGQALKIAGFKFDIAYTSILSRAQDTLQCILTEIGQTEIPVVKSWRLNEKHDGAVTGLNKDEAVAKYGEEQAALWRRGFDNPLPPMKTNHPYYESILKVSRYTNEFTKDKFPQVETLRSAIKRTLQFWNDTIAPQIKAGKTVIISSHENPLRGIIQYLDQLTDDQILPVDVPNAVPFVYTLDENLKPIKKFECVNGPESVKKGMEIMVAEEDSKL